MRTRKKLGCILAVFMLFALAFSACTAAAAEITISFELDGGFVNGEASAEPIVRKTGEAHGELPAPQKPGYVFTGWFYSADGSGEKVTQTTAVKYNADYTLYARYSHGFYTISFDLTGGTGKANDKIVTYDEKYGTLPGGIDKDGYLFWGWETEDGAPVTGADYVKIAGDHTLYAVWLAADWVILNGFEYSTSQAVSNAGITAVTRNDPWNISFLQNHGLSPSTTAAYHKSGSRSLQAMLYGDKSGDIANNPGWRPALKIPKTCFAAPYNNAAFADMYVIEADVYYHGHETGGSNVSTTPTAKCFMMLYAGSTAIPVGDVTLTDGWNIVRFNLGSVPAAQLADADMLALEFPNEPNTADRGRRYRFYIDDLRAVMIP
ncbi:MAG: InlB B-repeat-containing protein [Firmicutes bacterium]|nr:InlB B-repeat-containing protein [Bacillota bacterium]